MSDPSIRGNFLWYDLMTKDPAGAITFYTAIAGWKTQQWNSQGGGMDYTMWVAGETPMGGVMPLPDAVVHSGGSSHWIAYIGTPDVDATTKRAKELGGKVLRQPTDIPTVGRFAVLADPQGAVFAVFTPLTQAPERTRPPKLAEIIWHELVTTDYKAALDFYAELFGWERTNAMDMGAMGIYQMYGHHGQTLGGMFNMPGMPPYWFLYISVDDTDRVARLVTEHGGKVLNGPMDIPDGSGRIAQCADPQGAAFAIHSNAKTA